LHPRKSISRNNNLCVNVNQNVKKKNQILIDISHESFILSEESKKDRLTEITELLRLEHLDTQEKKV